jgi:hypothetical protein
MIGWQKWLGVLTCVLLFASCFMHWTWYPDIQKYFTGFFSERNYYGRPGMLLSFFALAGIAFFLLAKNWSLRLNLLFSAFGMAYAIYNFFKYTSSYDGIVPEKQAGIWLMLISSFAFLVMSILAGSIKKIDYPVEAEKEA